MDYLLKKFKSMLTAACWSTVFPSLKWLIRKKPYPSKEEIFTTEK